MKLDTSVFDTQQYTVLFSKDYWLSLVLPYYTYIVDC